MAQLLRRREGSHYHMLALFILAALVMVVTLSVRSHKPASHYVGWPAPISGPRSAP